MNLLLIRHAKAEGLAMNDAARNLVSEGRDQARRVGGFLKQKNLLPDVTLTSPYARAFQTAEILCETAEVETPITESWLACGMTPTLAMRELQAFSDFGTVALCGHNPDFAELAEWLLGSQAGGIHVTKASVIYFSQVNPPAQHADLEWLLPVALI